MCYSTVFDYIKDRSTKECPITCDDVMRECCISRGRANTHLKRLVDDKIIKRKIIQVLDFCKSVICKDHSIKRRRYLYWYEG